jgi:hypothetical protein
VKRNLHLKCDYSIKEKGEQAPVMAGARLSPQNPRTGNGRSGG